jgi:hypothetical protein
MAYPTEMGSLIGLWLSLAWMLMIYSYQLYKETQIYRFAEHTFVGITFAVTAVVGINNFRRVAIVPLMRGELLYIIPIIMGVLMYAVYIPQYRWVTRYSIATLVGSMLGVQMRGALTAPILSQIISTITPPTGGTMMSWVNFVYIAIGTFCTLAYFLLTHEHTGSLQYPTRLGRYLLMFGMGGMFGNTVMFRMAMLSGRAEFLLQVLKIIPM